MATSALRKQRKSTLREHRLTPLLSDVARRLNVRRQLRPQQILGTEAASNLEAGRGMLVDAALEDPRRLLQAA